MWTSHGHQIIGTIAEDPVTGNRPRLARCGGPGICKMCAMESSQAQKALGEDEFGAVPLLDESSQSDRMLGRIRFALILTRPMSEVDAISEKMAKIIAEHRVLMEANQTAKYSDTPAIQGEPTESGFYYNSGSAMHLMYLLDHNHQWFVISSNGRLDPCVWEFIEQSTGVYPLKKVIG